MVLHRVEGWWRHTATVARRPQGGANTDLQTDIKWTVRRLRYVNYVTISGRHQRQTADNSVWVVHHPGRRLCMDWTIASLITPFSQNHHVSELHHYSSVYTCTHTIISQLQIATLSSNSNVRFVWDMSKKNEFEIYVKGIVPLCRFERLECTSKSSLKSTRHIAALLITRWHLSIACRFSTPWNRLHWNSSVRSASTAN